MVPYKEQIQENNQYHVLMNIHVRQFHQLMHRGHNKVKYLCKKKSNNKKVKNTYAFLVVTKKRLSYRTSLWSHYLDCRSFLQFSLKGLDGVCSDLHLSYLDLACVDFGPVSLSNLVV